MRDVKNFVQDKFYARHGNALLKFREFVSSLLLWLLLIAPIVILFNSLSTGDLWRDVYFWTYQDGFVLANFISLSTLFGLVLGLVFSIGFVIRTNHYVTKVLPNKITYDQEGLKKREAVLEEIYTERFGDETFRENVRFYSVKPEQNFDNSFVRDTFKKEGCDF